MKVNDKVIFKKKIQLSSLIEENELCQIISYDRSDTELSYQIISLTTGKRDWVSKRELEKA